MITHNDATSMHMTTEMLRACDFNFQQRCTLLLEDNTVLHLKTILRIMPGKRMVALAEYNQETVVAKIFYSKKNALAHADREKKGADHLQKMKIPSPVIIANLVNAEKTAHILIFNYLHDADNLYTLWQEKHSIDILYPVLKQTVQELATQHVLGVIQHDLHFKNFMISPRKVFTLDGAQLSILPHKLDKEASMRHFALFLSQMGVGFESLQKELFLFYTKLRGWLIKPHEIHQLFFYIREINHARWQRHQRKIFRMSSQFALIQSGCFSGMLDRTRVPAHLRALFNNPEQFFKEMPHDLLKAGRSATVIHVTVADHHWVIKRYNIKHVLHRIKRAFSISRAKKSWYHAQKLALFGVNIPSPIAYIEKKQAGIKAEGYFISEYVDAVSLASLATTQGETLLENRSLINNVAALLKKLRLLEWTHGDLKATNIMIANNEPLLIDFDGAKEHASLTSARHHTLRDWNRFLKNFSNMPRLLAAFKEKLT